MKPFMMILMFSYGSPRRLSPARDDILFLFTFPPTLSEHRAFSAPILSPQTDQIKRRPFARLHAPINQQQNDRVKLRQLVPQLPSPASCYMFGFLRPANGI